MTCRVHPDPQEPAGGYAFLELPEGHLGDAPVTVAVFDAFGEKWLAANDEAGAMAVVGDAHWQQDRFEFGPYRVYRHDGADWVRIGPEIVNKIEEYAPLKIWIDGSDYDVTWPDNVPPRAGAAVLGGIQPVARSRSGQPQPVPVGRPQPPEQDTEPAGAAIQEPANQGLQDGEANAGQRSSLLPLLIVLFLLAGAVAAAWWYWPAQNTGQTPEPLAKTVPVATSDNTCTPEALGALKGGFAEVGSAIRGCGKALSPDATLAFVEDYANRGDPEALLLFGMLYDGEELDARIENLIGLTFEPDDTRAADYYARAVQAGSEQAAQSLQAVCQRLSSANSTLAKGAYNDFCE